MSDVTHPKRSRQTILPSYNQNVRTHTPTPNTPNNEVIPGGNSSPEGSLPLRIDEPEQLVSKPCEIDPELISKNKYSVLENKENVALINDKTQENPMSTEAKLIKALTH